MNDDRKHADRDTIVLNRVAASDVLNGSMTPEVPDIYAAFWEQVETRPRSCALVSGGEQVSYRELADLVDDAQRRVGRLDVREGQPVTLLPNKSPASIALVLAELFASSRSCEALAESVPGVTETDELLLDAAPPPRVAGPPGEGLLGRMIINDGPRTGVFSPAPILVPGSGVSHGDVVGTLGNEEVRSRFSGRINLVCAVVGERLAPYQPIAWLAPWDNT